MIKTRTRTYRPVKRSSRVFNRLRDRISKEMAIIRTRGSILYENDQVMRVMLNATLIAKLKRVYNQSEREMFEYAGMINLTRANGSPLSPLSHRYLHFGSPTTFTSHHPMIVDPPSNVIDNYIVYHTHPIPAYPGLSMDLFTIPSVLDFRVFVGKYPVLQLNMILERHGFYCIDLIGVDTARKPNPNDMFAYFMSIFDHVHLNRYITPYSPTKVPALYNGVLYKSTVSAWKRFINTTVDTAMKQRYNMSVRYFEYHETPVVTLVNRNTVLSSMTE